jgi:hypothetical protein
VAVVAAVADLTALTARTGSAATVDIRLGAILDPVGTAVLALLLHVLLAALLALAPGFGVFLTEEGNDSSTQCECTERSQQTATGSALRHNPSQTIKY